MMRRRPFNRRPLWRPNRRVALQSPARRMLFRANRLMDNGAFLEAGEIFEKLANGSLQRHLMLRSAHLFFDASRAYFHGGEEENGEILLRKGIDILIETGQWHLLHRIGKRIVSELNEFGKANLAKEIENLISENVSGKTFNKTSTPHEASQKARFPSKCPYCGGTVRTDEVEWIDPTSIICAYCGSTIHAETN